MRTSILVSGAGVALVVLAGCGSGSGSNPSSGRSATGEIHVASTSLGQVLVDGAGRTLYMLTADSPGRSSCDRSCLQLWPPVAPPSATTLPGISALTAMRTPGGRRALRTTAGGAAARCHRSSQTSSMRQLLKMLLSIRVSPLTSGCQQVPWRMK